MPRGDDRPARSSSLLTCRLTFHVSRLDRRDSSTIAARCSLVDLAGKRGCSTGTWPKGELVPAADVAVIDPLHFNPMQEGTAQAHIRGMAVGLSSKRIYGAFPTRPFLISFSQNIVCNTHFCSLPLQAGREARKSKFSSPHSLLLFMTSCSTNSIHGVIVPFFEKKGARRRTFGAPVASFVCVQITQKITH